MLSPIAMGAMLWIIVFVFLFLSIRWTSQGPEVLIKMFWIVMTLWAFVNAAGYSNLHFVS